MRAIVPLLLLGACTTVTVVNESDYTVEEVWYWDHGDPCDNKLSTPLSPGESVVVHLGPWDEPRAIYRPFGAREVDGACFVQSSGRRQLGNQRFVIHELDFDGPWAGCESCEQE